MLLKSHGDRFESTCKLIQDLIDAEIKTLEYMQEILPDTGETSLISDEVWGSAFLEAVAFSFENDGFTTLFKFLYEPLGFNSPKKHNKTLLNVFHQNIDVDDPKNILNILTHVRLSTFGILAVVFQNDYRDEYLVKNKQGEPCSKEKMFPSQHVSPFGDYAHSESGQLKKQPQLERKIAPYIRNEYQPFNLFIKFLMKKHNISKNKLAKHLPGNSDLEHKGRKLDKWCQYRAWGEKKGDPYNIKDIEILLNEIEADNDTQMMFAFMIIIDQIYIPEMITLPQKSWKDLCP